MAVGARRHARADLIERQLGDLRSIEP